MENNKTLKAGLLHSVRNALDITKHLERKDVKNPEKDKLDITKEYYKNIEKILTEALLKVEKN